MPDMNFVAVMNLPAQSAPGELANGTSSLKLEAAMRREIDCFQG
jgi:hypothetical protein